MLRRFALVVGVVVLGAAIGLFYYARFTNEDGDGIRPRQTLTALALGYERFGRCSNYTRAEGWNCDSATVRLVALSNYRDACRIIPDYPVDKLDCTEAFAKFGPEFKADQDEQANPPTTRVIAEWTHEFAEFALGVLLIVIGSKKARPRLIELQPP